jgi:hypothetical protein
MVREPEGSMIGMLIHLHDMCLIHELVHWCTGADEHHNNWNSLILKGLIISICEEFHRAHIHARQATLSSNPSFSNMA